MKNLGNMMKQAQQMQAKMAEMQEALETMEFTGAAGGGMVEVTADGKGRIKQVKLAPEVVDPEDIGVLEDLIVAAVNTAKDTADRAIQEKTQEMMGGLKLPPGMKLPF